MPDRTDIPDLNHLNEAAHNVWDSLDYLRGYAPDEAPPYANKGGVMNCTDKEGGELFSALEHVRQLVGILMDELEIADSLIRDENPFELHESDPHGIGYSYHNYWYCPVCGAEGEMGKGQETVIHKPGCLKIKYEATQRMRKAMVRNGGYRDSHRSCGSLYGDTSGRAPNEGEGAERYIIVKETPAEAAVDAAIKGITGEEDE